jgi:outer membrane beta-barrel protein
MNKRKTIGILILFMIMISIPVLGKDSKDEEKVFAIQERVFHHYHEIGLSFGYIPDDNFFNAYPVGIGYTYHFNNYLAWEVVRGQYMFTQEKDIKAKLEKEFGVTPEVFLEPKYMIHSNIIIKPLYGKEAFWNRGIINHESYLILGGGMINYEKKYSNGDTDSESDPSISLGAGTRYFLNKNLCMTLEIRDLINMKKDNTENNVYFGIGLSFQFNLFPRKTQQDETVDKLKGYLEEKENHE